MAYNLGTAEGRIVIDGSGAERGFAVATAAAQGFVSVVQARMDQIRNLGQNLVAVGAAGATGFGLAVRAASSFENELSAIEAVSGATAEEMARISEKALQLGKDTTFSASEAAQAMGELVKAGVPLEDILNGAADATVNLAAAGGVSLPEAATIASAAMNQFSLSGQQLPKVADMIAAAANASAIDVHDFGESLNQAGGVANLVGLSFDDLSVAIAEMGKQGYRGSDAGTSLKTMLLNLQPVTKAQTELFQNLGLIAFDSEAALTALARNGIEPIGTSLEQTREAVSRYLAETQGIPDNTKEMSDAVDKWLISNGAMQNAFFDTTGKLKPLAEVQQVLQDSLEGMTEQQKTATLEMLFGTDAIRAAAVMAENGAEGFNTLTEAMQGISAADVAETRMDNLSGSIEQLKGSVETAAIIIGNTILPVVRIFVDALTWLVNIFNDLPEPIQKAIGVLAAIATVLSLVSGAALILLTMLPAILGKMLLFRTLGVAIASIKAFWIALRAGSGVSAAIAAMAGPWVRFGRTISWIITLAKGMRVFWIALTGPIGIAVAAIAALVAAFIWAWNNIDGFKEGVMGILRTLGDFFSGLWDGIINAAKAVGDWFAGPFLDFFKGIPGFFADIWNNVVSWFTELPGRILGAIGDFGGWIANIFTTAWNGIVTGLSNAWDAVMSFLASLPQKIAYGLGWLAGTVVQLAIDGWNGLVDGLVAAWDAVWEFLSELPGNIADWFSNLGSDIADWASDTWKSVTTSISKAWDAALAWLRALPGRIGAWFTSLGTSILNWAVSAWNNLTTGAANAGTGLLTWLTELPGRIGEWFLSLGTSILNWAVTAWNNLLTGIQTAWTAVWEFIVGFPSMIGQAFLDAGSWLLEAGANIIQGLWDGIVNAWNAFWGWIGDLWNSFIQGFKDAMGISSPSSVFLELGGYLIQGLWNGIVYVWDQFIGFWSSLPGRILDFFKDTGSWLIQKGKDLLQGLWNGIVNIWNSVVTWFQELPGKILNFFADAGQWLLDAGKNIIQGLIDGVLGKQDSLWNVIGNAVSPIPGMVNRSLGNNSPSKYTMQSGHWLMEGLRIGISNSADGPANEAARAATMIGNAFHDSLPDLQAMLSANLEYLGPDLRTQLANDLTGLSATLSSGLVPGRIPPSAEVAEHAAKVENNFVSNVYNPVAEKASDSEARRLRAVSAIGAFSTP